MMLQHTGEDKWCHELKKQDDLLHTCIWKVKSGHSLEKFIAAHQNACTSMEQFSEHVPHQLPNELTRVTFLLDVMQCHDEPLQAAIASV